MNEHLQTGFVLRTLRLKVRREAYDWLGAAAVEVNVVWNWANEISGKAARPYSGKPHFLTGFDLNNLSAGATHYFSHIGSETIQRINFAHAHNRRQTRRPMLRWRASKGPRRALGWVPFMARGLKRKGRHVRFCDKTFRVFDSSRLQGAQWRQGCFAQDAVGDWWLCLSVRRAHKRTVKRLHRRAANRRRDALHKFSRKIVDQYQNIFVGDVSSAKLAKTGMAKAVHDAGWRMLKTQLQYKGEHAGRFVVIVSERFTTRACSTCGSLTGPVGLGQLAVRQWEFSVCGSEHDRDVNAARNILAAGLRCRASVCGNEPRYSFTPPSSAFQVRDAGGERVRAAA